MCGLTHLEESKYVPILSELLHSLFGFILNNNTPNEKQKLDSEESPVKQPIILGGRKNKEKFFLETVYTS